MGHTSRKSVTDNANNMTKAMRDAALPQFGYFAHSLKLTINNSLLSQREVNDMIAVCKSIVGYFHRSSNVAHNLKRIQASLDIPQHKLKQDITTHSVNGIQHFICCSQYSKKWL